MNKTSLNRWAARLGTAAMILMAGWAVVLVALTRLGQYEAGIWFAWTTALPILVLLPIASLILAILAAVAPPSKPNT